MGTERNLWRLLLSYRLSLIGLVVFAILTAVSILFQAKWISFLINQAVFLGAGNSSLSQAFRWLIWILIIRGLAQFFYQQIANRIGSRIVAGIRKESIQQVLPRMVKRDGSLTTGHISILLTDKMDALKIYFAQYLAQVLLAAILPILILFAVFPLDWISGVVFIFTAPLIPLFMILIGSQTRKATEYRWGYLSQLADHFADHIRGMEVLKQFNQSQNSLQAIKRVSTRYAAMTLDILKVTFLSALALELLTTLSTAVIAVEIGLRLLAFKLDFQTAFMILLIAPEFYLPLRILGLRFHAGIQGRTAAIELFELLGDQNASSAHISPQRCFLPVEDHLRLCLDGVVYSYPEEDSVILKNISLEMTSGSLTALIGRSGSGKSTLAKLILRFLQPQTGNIYLNQIPVDSLSLREWYQVVSWIGQKNFYTEGTILETIHFANPHASDQEVFDVLERVSLVEQINRLPRGINTLIDEFGQNFSGGEVQRLQIARALISPAPILILDEPTSQLDPDLEVLFVRELENLRTSKMILLIAHRLQTVMLADQILVLDDGMISERGNHAALMAQQGSYARMIAAYHQNRW